MNGYLLALTGVACGLLAAAIGDMASEEIRDRLDHLPHAILRLAARRLDRSERAAIYDSDWLPELIYILKGDEARPVTRVYHGVRFALGILITARRIARDLQRTAPLVESRRQARTGLPALATQARQLAWWGKYGDILPAWFEPFLGLEQAAASIRSFDAQFVPALFQTRDYAGVVERLGHQAALADEIKRRVELRLKRQELHDRIQPARIWAIIDEAVLRRPIGGPAVMRDQLLHLARMSEMPHVTLQVLPFAYGGHAGASGPFSILRFEHRDLPDVAYTEQLTSAVYLEQRVHVEHYLEVADQLSSWALSPADTTRFIEHVARET